MPQKDEAANQLSSRIGALFKRGTFGSLLGTLSRGRLGAALPPGGKIFGLGLSRTGTSSLSEALTLLGYRTVHYPYDAATEQSLLKGTKPSLFELVDAVLDITVVPFFKDLEELYPESRFIFTVRDKTRWLRSMQVHQEAMLRAWPSLEPQFKSFTKMICEAVYGSLPFDERAYSLAFDRHTQDVSAHFEGSHRLLVLDVDAHEKWPKLCHFLGRKAPKIAYPHANAGESDWAGWVEWRTKEEEVLRRIAQYAHAETAVIGATAFSSHGAQLTPFPADYTQSPVDDKAAIAATQAFARTGGQYLCIPWFSFWWMESYPDWATYLELRSERVLEDELCMVIRLTQHQGAY